VLLTSNVNSTLLHYYIENICSRHNKLLSHLREISEHFVIKTVTLSAYKNVDIASTVCKLAHNCLDITYF